MHGWSYFLFPPHVERLGVKQSVRDVNLFPLQIFVVAKTL